jgi:hypothetical protein
MFYSASSKMSGPKTLAFLQDDHIATEFYNSFHKVPEMVTSLSWPDNCCYKKILHKVTSCAIRTDLAMHRLLAYLRGLD